VIDRILAEEIQHFIQNAIAHKVGYSAGLATN